MAVLTESVVRLTVDDDIEKIIQIGEERTAELNSKYEGLNFEDLNNFKSDSMLQWEGEEGVKNVRILLISILQDVYDPDCHMQRQNLSLDLLSSLSKRERKLNYSVDAYYKETMRAGPAKTEKAPKLPRAPKQLNLFVTLSLSSVKLSNPYVPTGKSSSSTHPVCKNCKNENTMLIGYVHKARLS